MKKYIDQIYKKIVDISYCHKIEINPKIRFVSFTFDDAPKSAFVNGQNILNELGKRGTYYIALSFLETRPENKTYYSIKDLNRCISNNHELACHTYGHVPLNLIKSKKDIENELTKNRNLLKEIGINYDFLNFSYPHGEQTLQAKKIVSNHYLTCRGRYQGVNIGTSDVNNLKSIRLYEKTNSLKTIFSILEDFSKKGGWLIFYTHDVETNYSEFGCSPSYFKAIVEKCTELNIIVRTVKEMTKELGIKKHNFR